MTIKFNPVDEHDLFRSHAINEGLLGRWGTLGSHQVVIIFDQNRMQSPTLLGIAVPEAISLNSVLPSIFSFLRSSGYQGKEIWVCKLHIPEPGEDTHKNCVYLWQCIERDGTHYCGDIGMGQLAPGAARELREYISANPLHPTYRHI